MVSFETPEKICLTPKSNRISHLLKHILMEHTSTNAIVAIAAVLSTHVSDFLCPLISDLIINNESQKPNSEVFVSYNKFTIFSVWYCAKRRHAAIG